MKAPLAVVLVVLVAVGVAAANASRKSEHLPLKANGASVSATAELSGRGVAFTARGLPVGAPVVAAIGVYECSGGRQTGYAYADGSGVARWSARLPLSWARLHDGRHVVSIASDGRTIACASIPATHPAPPRHWGIWSFALRFTD